MKPSFFIVGAPKSGTTALSRYLGEHKDIFMCRPKEPHFFADDFPGYRVVTSKNEYIELFKHENKPYKVAGEASVYYLYSSCACRNIFNFNKHSRIIVMLRNPVDLVYSLHSQLFYTRNENISDFQKAWRAQRERILKKRIPIRCKDYKVLLYKNIGMLGKQVARLYDIFPSEQIKIILFDDFIDNPRFVYEQTLTFLDVEQDLRDYFPVINENCSHKIPSLSIVSNRVPEGIKCLVAFMKKIFNIQYELGFSRKIKELNTERKKREPLSSNFKKELVEAFSDDISLLSKIIERDLSCWKRKI